MNTHISGLVRVYVSIVIVLEFVCLQQSSTFSDVV